MPELPEVQTIASDLDDLVGGRVIEAVQVRLAKIVAGDPGRLVRLLTGAAVGRVERLGKWIIFRLEGPAGPGALLVHLKMTGQFHLGPWPKTDADWPAYAHAAFRLTGRPPESGALFYQDMRQFGRLRAFDPAGLEAFLAALELGPDPLTVTPAEFHRRLTARRGRLKGVLLDQSVVAGLGNIYADECLFAAWLSPLRSAASLTVTESKRLLDDIKRILTEAIAARGSTTNNYQGLKGGGSFQHAHQAYGRAGEPCPRCGAPLERLVVAGRSTHFCPHCQPAAPEKLHAKKPRADGQ